MENNMMWYSEKIKCADMVIDKSYQREPKETRINKIAKEWNYVFAQQPILSLRNDGKYYVLDGNHTRLAAIKRFGDEAVLICKIYKNLKLEEEAEIFYKYNTSGVKPKYCERLKALIASGDQMMVEYDNTLKSVGVKTSYDYTTSDYFSCHSIGVDTFKKYGQQVFKHALEIIKKTWGDSGFKAHMVLGMATFCNCFQIDDQRAVKCFSKQNYEDIIKIAKGYAPGFISHSSGKYTALALCDLYNKGTYKEKLDKTKLI